MAERLNKDILYSAIKKRWEDISAAVKERLGKKVTPARLKQWSEKIKKAQEKEVK